MLFKNYLQSKYKYVLETLARKEKIIKAWQALCTEDHPLEKRNAVELLKLISIEKEKYEAGSLNNHLKTLEQYFYYLLETEKITHHPLKNFRLKRGKPKLIKNLLKEKELEQLYVNHRSQRKDKVYLYRNKILLGLIIYQGLESSSLCNLRLKDIDLAKATIKANPQSSKLNPRVLSLASVQIMDLHLYITKYRKELINLANEKTEKDLLFLKNTPSDLAPIYKQLSRYLHKTYSNLKAQNLRKSRIVLWLQTENEREVQYKSGYKSLLSLVQYKEEDLERLKQAVAQYHPGN